MSRLIVRIPHSERVKKWIKEGIAEGLTPEQARERAFQWDYNLQQQAMNIFLINQKEER